METRKIQEVSNGTFTVSLPKAWTTAHGFEAGMELRLYPHRDGTLVLRSSEADVEWLEDTTVDIDGGGADAVKRAVRTAHMVGFETITLTRNESFTAAEHEAIRSTVRELTGTDIIAESPSEVTIKHLLDTSSFSVRQSIIQLQYVVVSLLRDATEAFVDAAETPASVRARAAEARRSVEMVTRHFSRSLVSYNELDKLGVSRPELFAYYEIATHLETVIEQAVGIENTATELGDPPADAAVTDIYSVVDDVACAVDDAVTAVLNADLTKSHQARAKCDAAAERLSLAEQRLYDESGSESVAAAVALANTLSQLRRTAECSRSMADIAAQTAIRTNNIDL